MAEKKKGMLSMRGFGLCFLLFFFNYTTGGCLASLPFIIFCSFLFGPPIPLPLLIPSFPLLVVSLTHVDDVFFFSYCIKISCLLLWVEELGAYERCETML